MRNPRNGLLLLALLLVLAGVVVTAVQLAPDAAANGERVEALRVLAASAEAGSIDELAWDAGWRSLCSPGAASGQEAASQEAVEFIARSLIDRGDYAGALAEFRRAAAGEDSVEAELARAFVAALEMRWTGAARLYPGQPTPRHQRFWGTVFYLAAQELMFRGQTAEAAQWYRRADQSYGVHGPFLGLGLVDCLAQQGRTLEAFDAYRRALVVLPPDEALAQRERFEQMRLDALRAWKDLDPGNPQVAGWLDFYENDRPVAETETLAEAPQPQVALAHDLDDGRRLVGFEYRPEDIATGPFMWVDLYVQEGTAEGSPVTRLRRAVLNQAPNGSFAWDAAPDGVRPFGWHGLVYLQNLDALQTAAVFPGERGQCMDAGRIGGSFGLQSLQAQLGDAGPYVQGGQLYAVGPASLSLGRQWYEVADPYNYSYVNGRPEPDQPWPMAGVWEGPANASRVAVWLLAHGDSQGCFNQLLLFHLL
jgi:tetratricopeptide (TPR) repeat protein